MSRAYPAFPVPAVGAVVWRGDEILLVRRGNPPRQGDWSLPGGCQELGETIEEAARREIREETGIEIDVLDIAAAVDLIDRDEDGRVRHHYVIVDVVAEWLSGEAVAADDAAAVAWVAYHDLAAFALTPQTLGVIMAAHEKRRAARRRPA